MKKYTYLSFLALMLLTLTSCQAVETIFKAGMYWAFFLVALVLGFIIWLLVEQKNKYKR
jgi:hypothetical protein